MLISGTPRASTSTFLNLEKWEGRAEEYLKTPSGSQMLDSGDSDEEITKRQQNPSIACSVKKHIGYKVWALVLNCQG